MKSRVIVLVSILISTLANPVAARIGQLSTIIQAPVDSVATVHPILYVTQVPVPDDPMTVATTFGNHRGEPTRRGAAATYGFATQTAHRRT